MEGLKPRDRHELLEALGGPQGLADSSIPALAFVLVYTFNGNELNVAAWVAVGIGAVITVIRLLRRESLQFAVAGFVGVAIAAFIASRPARRRTSSCRGCCSMLPTRLPISYRSRSGGR